MQGEPASTDHGVLTISMSPGMTIHSHVAAKDFMSDTYQGYNAKTNTHWLSTSDVFGDATLETSTDGSVYTGTTWQGAMVTPTRDTYSKISETKIRDFTEIKQNDKWAQLADTICTKG